LWRKLLVHRFILALLVPEQERTVEDLAAVQTRTAAHVAVDRPEQHRVDGDGHALTLHHTWRMIAAAYLAVASRRACSRVVQARRAHLMRTGNFWTPSRASRSPRASVSTASPCIMPLKVSISS